MFAAIQATAVVMLQAVMEKRIAMTADTDGTLIVLGECSNLLFTLKIAIIKEMSSSEVLAELHQKPGVLIGQNI